MPLVRRGPITFGTLIDRYLWREAIPPLLFGLVLYSSLAVTSNTLWRLQWIVGTPVGELSRWLLLQMPQALVQVAPIALVLSVLLAFGRLSSDQELTALQAGTVPLLRATLVFITLGGAIALAALAVNEWVLPRTNVAVVDAYWRLTAGRSGLFRLAAQDLAIDDFRLTIGAVDARDELRDVRVERWDGDVLTIIRAERGRFVDQSLVLVGHRTQRLDLAALDAAGGDAEGTLRRLVRLDARARDPEAELTISVSLTVDELIARFGGGGFEDARSLSDLAVDAAAPTSSPTQRRRSAALLQRKLAEPLANVTLLLVAIPLSITYARSRSVAFGLSLVVTLAWYLLLTFGQLFAQTGVLPLWLGPWIGNLVLGGVGVGLLVSRARDG
jgi:lipopolysaccharide export system permease protein